MRRQTPVRTSSPLLFLSRNELDIVVSDDGLYDLLDVRPSATSEEIRRSYRAKAKEFHPDLNSDCPHTAEQMVRLNQAREILVCETLRGAYDWLRPGLLGT